MTPASPPETQASGLAADGIKALVPRAAERLYPVESPNGSRLDPYYWLRDDGREEPEVLAYLNAENAYYEKYAARYKGLSEQLLKEMRGRIKEDDSSVPYRSHGYLYQTRYETGAQYPLYTRRLEAPDAGEEILLDVAAMAKGHDFYEAFPAAISYDQQHMAFAEDKSGRRQYTLRIKDLKSGAILDESIEGTSADCVFSRDGQTLFYVENDSETLRSCRVKKHRVGSPPSSDTLVYEEADTSFYTSISESGSEQYIIISMSSTVSDEEHVLRADDPEGAPMRVAARQRDFHYSVDHIEGRWVILTDWDAPNYRLMQVADGELGERSRWANLIAHSPDVFINGFALFDNYLVLDERSTGLRRLRVQAWKAGVLEGEPSYVRSDEPAYTAALSINPEQSSEVLRYAYGSLTTPATVYDLNMRTGERLLKKQQPVLGHFDASQYHTERLWAKAKDGSAIPISLVKRRDTKVDGSAPLLQYAYGSYGYAMDPSFSSNVLSLLERGFVYAIAHVRGGSEMGRAWYEDGKKLNKLNTFTDFIAVTEYLVASGYADPSRVFARGGSAGGLLMGALANLRGDLYCGLLADVPFVDVVTTMLDETIPLTSNEFDEWGNPKEREFYDYMLSYSPYDNVSAKDYPAIMVTTGLFDSQVQYFEPAKWVAKLRAHKTNDRPLIFKTNMEAGHGGKSGRFSHLEEMAEQYAFMIDLAGLAPANSNT
jgi:oligopeptidase B